MFGLKHGLHKTALKKKRDWIEIWSRLIQYPMKNQNSSTEFLEIIKTKLKARIF
jgi:hypothetical protein